MIYSVRKAPEEGVAAGISYFHVASTPARPETLFRVVHCDEGLRLRFEVKDCFVRSVCTETNGPVCKDSCVEFFFQPEGAAGYVNIEVNPCGTAHISLIRDPRRVPGGFADRCFPDASGIRIATSHSGIIDPETAADWFVAIEVPYAFMHRVWGAGFSRRRFRANFYKCGDATSHPHWASWAPIGEKLDFHAPEYFGVLELKD